MVPQLSRRYECMVFMGENQHTCTRHGEHNNHIFASMFLLFHVFCFLNVTILYGCMFRFSRTFLLITVRNSYTSSMPSKTYIFLFNHTTRVYAGCWDLWLSNGHNGIIYRYKHIHVVSILFFCLCHNLYYYMTEFCQYFKTNESPLPSNSHQFSILFLREINSVFHTYIKWSLLLTHHVFGIL